MREWISRFIVILCVLSFSAPSVLAQNKSQLEKKRDALSQKIKLANKLLSTKESTRKSKQSELILLNKQIGFREELVSTLHAEVRKINTLISKGEKLLFQKEEELKELKSDYAQLIRQTYKNRSAYNKLMFVFAANSFNQAVRRMQYLNQYTTYRKQQAEKITLKQEEITKQLQFLRAKKDEKEVLLASQKNQKKELLNDKSQQTKYIASLKQEESKLRRELKSHEKEKRAIAKKIQNLIAAELSRNRKKSTSGKFTLTPSGKALSDSFEKSKTSLPWPVERGIVTGNFGRHAHPTVRGVTIENKGITISTEKEAKVRAIYRGEVSIIMVIPGAGKVVMLNHGAYRTVYTNLKDVSVKKGDSVFARQSIGTCLKAEDGEKSEAHIEIWKISETGGVNLNPIHWLIPK